MRADRLLSILLLLQVNRRLTAAQLACRLEVSERTILRDMEALSGAGIPVVATRGAGGGWGLVGGYQTRLTGLTPDEVRSLFLGRPSKLMAELGLQQASESAWTKLRAALPTGVQQQADFVSQRIVIDPRGWRDTADALTGLPAILKGLWSERRIRFQYVNAVQEPGERVVDPLGLVARGAVWYLIASRQEQLRTYRVSRMRDVIVQDEPAVRPVDFDLGAYWEQSATKFREQLPQYHATYLAAPSVMKWASYRGWRLLEQIPAGDRIRIRLRFDIEEEALQFALGFGADIELVEPVELRDKVLRAAECTVRVYQGSGAAAAVRGPAVGTVRARRR